MGGKQSFNLMHLAALKGFSSLIALLHEENVSLFYENCNGRTSRKIAL